MEAVHRRLVGLGGARGPLRRILPDPGHEGGWSRLWGQDVATLSPRARRWERLRLERAIATADDPDRIPRWVWDRLEQLSEPGPAGGSLWGRPIP